MIVGGHEDTKLPKTLLVAYCDLNRLYGWAGGGDAGVTRLHSKDN